MLIAHYRSGSEFIEITKESNGLYFIGYGAGFSKTTGQKYYNCTAGGFSKYVDAVETLKKHRPAAEEIKTYCANCKNRKMLSFNYELGKCEFIHCNGTKVDTCWDGCVCCK